VVLANARMSEKSAKGYARFAKFTASMLKNIYLAAIQNEEDAQRLIQLGLPAANAQVIGNIKFDLSIDDTTKEKARQLKHDYSERGNKTVFIAASTHNGEDEIILDAFKLVRQSRDDLKLLLVPRHPERFDSVFELCKKTSLHCARRTSGEIDGADILLGDTMGELLMLYGAADIAFVGGSFVENGGHNYIEPAAWGLPILSGPSTFNFRETAQELAGVGAMTIVADANELATEVQILLENKDLSVSRGKIAQEIADKNRGALSKLTTQIDQIIEAKPKG
jgi:3-deoxy-D-manno-octulosonic-acid transferase